eukprot:6254883-Prymnesium_polylepis.1
MSSVRIWLSRANALRRPASRAARTQGSAPVKDRRCDMAGGAGTLSPAGKSTSVLSSWDSVGRRRQHKRRMMSCVVRQRMLCALGAVTRHF